MGPRWLQFERYMVIYFIALTGHVLPYAWEAVPEIHLERINFISDCGAHHLARDRPRRKVSEGDP